MSMIKVTHTKTFDGSNKAEYEQALNRLELEAQKVEGWQLIKEPLVNRVTAVKVEEVQAL